MQQLVLFAHIAWCRASKRRDYLQRDNRLVAIEFEADLRTHLFTKWQYKASHNTSMVRRLETLYGQSLSYTRNSSFTHPRRPVHYQTLMFFIVPLGHLHKTSFKSIRNFLSNVIHKQTDEQTFTTKTQPPLFICLYSLNNNKPSRFCKVTHTRDFQGLQLVH